MIKIIFPDGQIKEYSKGITPIDIALSISEGLARNVLAAKLNDQVVDSSTPILLDSNLQLIDVRTPEEFNQGFIKNAKNVNWNGGDFETEVTKSKKPKTFASIFQSMKNKQNYVCSLKYSY